MSVKNRKQFGVWMDSHDATIVGRDKVDTGDFIILGHAKNAGAKPNSNEKTGQNEERTLQHKFFREIAAHMQNVDDLHVTGTGTSQEQFMHYMADTAQYKDMQSNESTSNRMSEEKLIAFISAKFN